MTSADLSDTDRSDTALGDTALSDPAAADGTEPGLARRLRFRQALGRLAAREQTVDLLKLVLVPGAVLMVGGVVLMVLGWDGAAHTARQIEQIPYLISGGLIGLALVLVGGLLLASAFWLTVLRRFNQEAEDRAGRQLRALEDRLAELEAGPGRGGGAGSRSRRAS